MSPTESGTATETLDQEVIGALRNGSRPRTLSKIAGDLELRIPNLRTGSFFPSLLERRRRVDRVLFAVVMAAYAPAMCSAIDEFLIDAER